MGVQKAGVERNMHGARYIVDKYGDRQPEYYPTVAGYVGQGRDRGKAARRQMSLAQSIISDQQSFIT